MTRTEKILKEIVDNYYNHDGFTHGVNVWMVSPDKLATYLASLEEKIAEAGRIALRAVERESTPSKCTCPPPKPYDWMHHKNCPKIAHKEPNELPAWKGRWYAFNTNFVRSIDYHPGNPPSVIDFLEEEIERAYREGFDDAEKI